MMWYLCSQDLVKLMSCMCKRSSYNSCVTIHSFALHATQLVMYLSKPTLVGTKLVKLTIYVDISAFLIALEMI